MIRKIAQLWCKIAGHDWDIEIVILPAPFDRVPGVSHYCSRCGKIQLFDARIGS